MDENAIVTQNLTKHFKEIRAVDGINLEIPKGKIFGFLGPNGAGKSTTISMLSTILPPTSGTATILGFDLIKDRKKIRDLIGVCPQDLIFWERLTARENIRLIAQMHNIHPKDYKERTDELLAQMHLLDRADSLAKTYSGGMKRRLNVLMAVIHEPEVIFLDEPSAGLDPQSRLVVWDFIKGFERKNATVILTTHYMEEADDLSDDLTIIDHGHIIAQGTPQELKAKMGTGDVIEFGLNDTEIDQREKIIETLQGSKDIMWVKALGKRQISFGSMEGLRKISTFYDIIEGQFGIKMHDVAIRQNTLEDVFINLTGRQLRE